MAGSHMRPRPIAHGDTHMPTTRCLNCRRVDFLAHMLTLRGLTFCGRTCWDSWTFRRTGGR